MKWVQASSPHARSHVAHFAHGEWIVLFYDSMSAHMTSAVVEVLLKHRIEILSLPVHISDRFQPLSIIFQTTEDIFQLFRKRQKKMAGSATFAPSLHDGIGHMGML